MTPSQLLLTPVWPSRADRPICNKNARSVVRRAIIRIIKTLSQALLYSEPHEYTTLIAKMGKFVWSRTNFPKPVQ
jgi:hypothetical protein